MTFGDGIDWDAEARRAASADLPGAAPGETLSNIIEALGPAKPGTKWRIVDCGCNIARFYPQFNEAGFEYVGIDQSPQALLTAAERYPGVEFHKSMLWEDWPAALGPFDAALCNAVLQHNKGNEKAGILTQIARAVHPGGVFAMQESTMLVETETQLTHENWIRLVQDYGFRLINTWHPNPEYGVNDGYIFRRLG